jgi:hypothetical protein
MLPDFANIALNEEAGNFFSKFNGIEELQVCAFYRWAAWVILSITNAPDCFVFFFLEIITSVRHVKVFGFRDLLVLVLVIALSPPTKKSVVKVLKRFRGQ